MKPYREVHTVLLNPLKNSAHRSVGGRDAKGLIALANRLATENKLLVVGERAITGLWTPRLPEAIPTAHAAIELQVASAEPWKQDGKQLHQFATSCVLAGFGLDPLFSPTLDYLDIWRADWRGIVPYVLRVEGPSNFALALEPSEIFGTGGSLDRYVTQAIADSGLTVVASAYTTTERQYGRHKNDMRADGAYAIDWHQDVGSFAQFKATICEYLAEYDRQADWPEKSWVKVAYSDKHPDGAWDNEELIKG